jgi:geranyl-CoA carboxylase beta subunit
MTLFQSAWNAQSPLALQRREAMLARIAALRALEERSAAASAKSRPAFDKRGQLLPRGRVALLLDAGAPWLPLCSLAGYLQDGKDAAQSVPGGGVVAGIGFVSGVRCMVVASDSGIEAGAVQAMGLEKILRAQEIALQGKLPFIHLVESAGANLMRYRVEGFVQGGALFRNLARLSAAGIPVITVQHGSGTAGGAYMPGLSDVVIMVRNRSRAFLAGPPLLMAATGRWRPKRNWAARRCTALYPAWANSWPGTTAKRWAWRARWWRARRGRRQPPQARRVNRCTRRKSFLAWCRTTCASRWTCTK